MANSHDSNRDTLSPSSATLWHLDRPETAAKTSGRRQRSAAFGPSLYGESPARGDRIGENNRFEIVEKLGAGGMGHVFRAVDWHLDRTVAVKFILQNHDMPLEQIVGMLKREAKTTAKLNHENIVAIFDMDAYNGVPFLVMELLDGHSLDVLLEASRLNPLRATRLMAQVARGLAHAHANGIIHRDLKPSNVFILRDGRAKILDFGISYFERSVSPAAPIDLVPTMIGIGTPAFMAPEQWRNGAQDARTDIWAAGVMFYQMLTGQLPYSASEFLQFTTRDRVRRIAPSVRLIVPTLPEEADRLVATTLNEDPEGRFQTAQELLEALNDLEGILVGRAASSEGLGGVALHVERRPLTLLSCRLEGLSALELDDRIELEERFYRTCADVVKSSGGCIGTPIGGRFFSCFGYPVVRETDAQTAVRCALKVAQLMREQSARDALALDFKIGIHSGIVGLPSWAGSPQGIPAMLGDVPNVAASLVEAAAPGTVVMSETTRNLSGGLFLLEPLASDAERADGQRSAPTSYSVLGEVVRVSRFDLAFSDHFTPFVGREAEMDVLRHLWEEAKDGRGQIVVVSGEPGIGKSRLVQTLKERVVEEDNIRMTCQCWPHFKNSALHPLIELILRSMDIRREDTPEQKLAKLESNLSALGFPLPETGPLFGSLLSIPFEPKYAPLGLAPEQHKVKTLEALVSLLLRSALSHPVLFVIEDMHWVDHSTIEYLNALIDLVPFSRVLVVLTCRPSFRAPWTATRHLHHLSLDRLSSASTISMIEHASKERRLPPDMIERLVVTTDGVPLFVEELTRMIVESWQPDAQGQKDACVTIPGTLHELLLARLDRLRGSGKEVAQLGAILGRNFSYAFIRHVSPFDEMSLEQGLDILARAGLLHCQGKVPDSKYVFKHALIQQVAYQSLVKRERQRHHQRAAQVLAEVFPETAELAPELLAHHHAEAGNVHEAIAFWERAGQRATQRSALVEAIDHYRKALDSLKTLPESAERNTKEMALLLALGSPLMSVHGYASPEVEKTYARARELARAVGAEADLFPAMQGLWQFYYVRGMLPTSRALGEQLLEIAKSTGSSTFLLLAHRSYASSAFLQGDFETCRVHTQAGFSIYDMREHGSLALRTGHDPGVAHGVYLAWSLWMLGYPDQALARVTEMVELARRLDHPLTNAYALCFAALIRNHRGDHAEARELSDAALEITTKHKFALWTAWAKMQRGWALAGMRDYLTGIPQMKEGLDGWSSTGARVGFTFFPVTLAEMCLHASLFDETARLLSDAKPMVERNDEHFYEPELVRLEGELTLKLADGSGAEPSADAHFLRGIDLARAKNAKSWALRLSMSRGQLLARQGNAAQAYEELRDVYSGFSEGYETADLRSARALMEAWHNALAGS